MKLDQVPTTGGEQVPTFSEPPIADDLIIKEARRRHRWRVLFVSVLVALVISLIGFGIASIQGGQPPAKAITPTSVSPPSAATGASSTSLGVAGTLAVSPAGRLYVADVANDRILVRLPDGQFAVAVGTGTVGFAGDGGPATEAELTNVTDIAFAPNGSLYIADGNRIRVVTPAGIISTVAGNGGPRQPVTSGTPALSASLGSPLYLALSPNGDQLYIEGGLQILALTTEGTLVTVPAETTSGIIGAGSANPIGVDAAGTLFIDGCAGWSICEVAPDGQERELGYARRSGGNLSVLQRGPDGTVYGEDGSAIVRATPGGLVTAYQFSGFFSLTNFAIAPNGVVYADEMPGNVGFEAHQELISDQAGRYDVLWQEENSTPQPAKCAVYDTGNLQSPAPLAQVPGGPESLVGTWLAGPNADPCRPSVVNGGAMIARKLAHDIDQAPAWDLNGSCPPELGEGVRLTFYGSNPTRAMTTAAIDITGCGVVMADSLSPPGVGLRSLTPAIRADLRTLAPPHWARLHL